MRTLFHKGSWHNIYILEFGNALPLIHFFVFKKLFTENKYFSNFFFKNKEIVIPKGYKIWFCRKKIGMSLENKRKYFILIGVLLLHSLGLHYFWDQIGDDSYIFFRYVINVKDHAALVWNIGQKPVEGFSSPLWIFLLTGFSYLTDVVWGSKALGAIFSILSLIRVWQLSDKDGLSTLGASIGMGILYWSISGLETSLHCFYFSPAYLLLVEKASVFWLALLGLVRPETPLLAAIGILIVFQRYRKRKYFLLILPTIMYLAFRLWYFGELLPNTYFAKATGEPLTQILRGLQYSVVPIVALFFLWKNKIVEYSEMLLPCSLLLILVGGGGDWMWHERLLVPIYLVLWGWSGMFCGFRRVGMMIVLFSSTVPWKYWDNILLGEQLSPLEYQEGTLVGVSEVVAEDIKQNIPEGATIALIMQEHYPIFLPEYSFVDMTGLNDHWIARQDGDLHEKFDSEYVLNQKPDLIVMNTLSNPKEGFGSDYWVGETDLFEHPRFKDEYMPIAKSWKRRRYLGKPAFIVLFIRRKNI